MVRSFGVRLPQASGTFSSGGAELIGLLLKILLAYLLGSLSGSLMLGFWRHVDIRRLGSGNAGGTNAFRTQGFRFALAVVAIDVAKGALAAGALPLLALPTVDILVPQASQALYCGFAAVIGHCFPVWHGFRGGKGAATAVGVLVVVQPLSLAPMLLTWLLVLGLSGWVGLATLLAAISLLPVMWWLEAPAGMVYFVIALATFLVFTHRSNIRNMLAGREYRFEKARFRNWLR